jgi:two-component system, chemotaxis family, CheB/CheR fusion protein
MTDAPTSDPEFDALLEYLKRTRGFDFNAYKPPSLRRRIEKRMHAIGIDGFAHYTDYLEVHPDEFAALFDVILINVTAFFRDSAAWGVLRDQVLPALLAARPASEPVRVWSAGCASGEETYSIAMLLAEALGREAFRTRVKIYATDADEGALNQARAAAYSAAQVEQVPADLLSRYFTRDGDRYVFDKDLRRSVIFGRHDVIQDAPISRVHLLVCRNALMYFNTEAQTRIVHRFHFALTDDGVLFLGKAEMLFAHTALFAPIELRSRLFRKVRKNGWRDRMALINRVYVADDRHGADPAHAAVYPAAFDVSPNAQFVLDGDGLLTLFNERARALFNVVPSDLGRPLQDLELSYRPIELRSHIKEALELRRPVILHDVEGETAARERRWFDVQISPLADAGAQPIGVSVTFTDVSRVQDLQTQLTRSKQDLETAYEELQSTNEELETTNEELQSTVEELETTNEELQSTNEELETMNAELQATNEEMETANDDLRHRGDELRDANALLEAILTGVRSSVIVLDRELRVIAWNRRSEDLWGVRSEEVRGQNFLNLDIGLPADPVRSAIRACLAGDADKAAFVVAATNRRGKPIACRVTGSPLAGANREPRGVILMIDEETLESSASPAVH